MDKDELYYEAISLLEGLISIKSISREEDKAADYLYAFIERTAPNCKLVRLHNNVYVTAPNYNPNKPTILLNSHIDTVKPVSGWDSDAFTPIVDEDRVVGLGSNDAGASLVSLLATFIHLQNTTQSYNLIFAASAEEEVSGKNGMELLITKLPKIELGVIGEPTAMQPAVAEKGLMVLDCAVRGVSGHAARNEGVNAIYKAIPIIEQIKDYNFAKVSPQLRSVKLSVTQIQSGTQHNVVPDICTFVVDVRGNGEYTNMEIYDELAKAIPECEFTARSFRLNSSSIDCSHPFIARAELLGLTPFGSATLSDQALIPYTTVKIGPGESSRSHTANEYILKGEIREAIEVYIKLLSELDI